MSQKWLELKEKGNAQFKNNNYTGAADYYTRGIQLNPSEPVLYSNRATCMKLLGKYKEAINDYNKAIELNPKNTKNLKKLSNVYVILGDFGHAQLLLEKCCNLETNDSSHVYELNKVKKWLKITKKLMKNIKSKNGKTVKKKVRNYWKVHLLLLNYKKYIFNNVLNYANSLMLLII